MISGCATKSDIDDLQEQINSLKSDQIQTISSQITAINNSLTSLQNTDSQLKTYIETLQRQAESLETASGNLEKAIAKAKADLEESIANAKADLEASIDKAESDMSDSLDSLKAYTDGKINAAQEDVINQLETLKASIDGELSTLKSTIESLQKKDEDLQNQIDGLKDYVKTELTNTKDWAKASFASLDEYNETAKIVAGIQTQIENINDEIADIKKYTSDVKADLEQALNTLKTELQNETDEAVAALKKELLAEIETASEDAAKALEEATEEITDAYTAAIAGAIKESETSMQTWVNEQLTGYYTIAQMDTQLELLQGKIDKQKTDLQTLIEKNKELVEKNKELIEKNQELIEKTQENIDNNADNIQDNADAIEKNADAIEAINKLIESNTSAIGTLEGKIKTNTADIAQLQSDLAQQKTEITIAYTQAISDACAADGVIGKAIQAKIDAVNTTIETLTGRVSTLETTVTGLVTDVSDLKTALNTLSSKVTSLSGTVDDIKARLDNLASISYIPTYSDHIERITYTGLETLNPANAKPNDLTLCFDIYPASAAAAITKEVLIAKAVYTLTRASARDFVDLTIKSATANNGVLTVVISEPNLGTEFLLGKLSASLILKVRTNSNVFQSEYIHLTSFFNYMFSNFDTNSDGIISDYELTKIKTLDISGMGVTSLSGIVDKMTILESLNCSNNNLTELDVSKNTKLTTLNVKGNKSLTVVNFASLAKIESCTMSYDSSISLYVSGNTPYMENVAIDGLRWAKYAVGASESNLYGKRYTYTAIKTACPTGWRVPTKAEYESLMKNYSGVVTYNNVKGRLFSGSKSYYVGPSIFLTIHQWQGFGAYWTSTTTQAEDNPGGYYMFNFNSSSVEFSQGANSDMDCYIRCVSDK